MQYDFGVIDPQVKTGTALASDLNQWRDAVHSTHWGVARPAYAIAGTLWVDDSTAPNCVINVFDGTADIPLLDFNSSTHTGGAGGSGFATGTRMLFAQAAAPEGWVQVTDDIANNRMLRVVAGAGGGYGGTHDPVINNVVPAHTHSFTTGVQSADHVHSGSTSGESVDHSHAVNDPGHVHTEEGVYQVEDSDGNSVLDFYPTSRTTGAAATGIWNSGSSAAHSHTFSTGGMSAAHSHSGSTDNGSSQTNWTPRYVDLILCAKD